MNTCTCNDARPHRVAWRRTADGAHVELWHDGSLTGAGGLALPGVPIARPRTEEARRQALAAGWLVVGELARTTEDPAAALYDVAELPLLYATARRLVAARGLGATPGELRAAFAEVEEGERLDRLVRAIRWENVSGELWHGHLPRFRWPHLAVHRERGRYEVLVSVRRLCVDVVQDVLEPTGHTFTSARDLARHLLAVQTGARS